MRARLCACGALLMLVPAWHAPAMPPLPLADAAQRALSSACSAAALDEADASLIQAAFQPDGAGGSLKKFALAFDEADRVDIASSSAPIWDAGALLEAMPPQQRAIFTASSQADGSLRTVALNWEALDDEERRLLGAAWAGSADGLGRQRLAWLRGERDAEQGRPGAMLRRRERLLGATVEGTPLLAGRGEQALVYLAANDGMLHAFDAKSGREAFAYLPRSLGSWWSRLSAPDHAPYVEGAITAGDALLRGGRDARGSVLAGAMGSAAQGVYALDISDPAHFGGERGVLFEFTERDDADIGNIFGAPVLARLRIGAAVGDYLAVGGGYNSAARGRLALFLLSLNKDAAEPWQLNRNYFKLTAPADDAWPNGLGPAALAADENGNARFAYAGDLQGNLWRFDLGALATGEDGARKLVFIATDKDGRRQPITSAPRIAYAADGLLLLFGTGRLLAPIDGNDRSPQTLYGVRDHAASVQPLRRDSLVARLLALDGSYRLAAVEAADGWYLDFPEAGERSIASALLADDQLVAASIIPRGAACAAGSRLYWLQTLSGKPAPGVSAPWLLPAEATGRKPLLLPRIAAGPPEHRGQRADGIRRSLVGAGAGDAAGAAGTAAGNAGSVPGAASRTGRLGWREIIDIEGLRDAALRP